MSLRNRAPQAQSDEDEDDVDDDGREGGRMAMAMGLGDWKMVDKSEAEWRAGLSIESQGRHEE